MVLKRYCQNIPRLHGLCGRQNPACIQAHMALRDKPGGKAP
jgi:hypothetical protein